MQAADVRLEVRHTALLSVGEQHALRRLLDDAYAGDFSNDDWAHALGGLHVLAFDATALIGHASVVQRSLWSGRPLRAGYVEAVAVTPARRRQGLGDRLLEQSERLVQAAYELGALSASDEGARLYERRGWLRWRGPTGVLTPGGLLRTPDDDGGLFVFPVHAPLDLGATLACDLRTGDVW